MCRRLRRDPQIDDVPPVLVSFWNGGRVIGSSLRLPPEVTSVSGLPVDELDAVAVALADIDPEQPGVTGPRPIAEGYAEAWAAVTGATVKETMAGRLHRLTDLVAPVVPGRARLATADDLPTLAAWHTELEVEAMGLDRNPERAETDVRRSMAQGNGLILWELDGRAVAHAGAVVPVGGMSRIGDVYTPPQLRGCGYGSAVAAAASRWALDAGAEHVVLFTDLANPVSNSIYRRIGYRPVEDTTQLAFHK